MTVRANTSRRKSTTRTARTLSSVKKTNFFSTINKAKFFPYLLAFTCLAILFVLIRMKGIEQDYKMNEISSLFKVRLQENKELKADKARLLSIKQLELFAHRYDLKEPDEKHIIIIPE